MKALIEMYNNNRIAQIVSDDSTFPVASGLKWITCPDICTTHWSYYEGQFILPAESDLSKQEVHAVFARLAQEMMDSKVRERNYEGIISACSYSTSSYPKFAAEAAACIAWRDAVWEKCYALLDTIKPGNANNLSEEDFLALLPSLTWPDEQKGSLVVNGVKVSKKGEQYARQ